MKELPSKHEATNVIELFKAKPEIVDWELMIPPDEWDLYTQVIERFRARAIRFAVGGGMAFSEYARRFRNTKDLDLYVHPMDRELARDAILAAGFEDYFETKPYDRSWIFRGHKGGVIVDAIWSSPNHRVEVDGRWLSRGREVCIRGTTLRCIPPEELIWAKIFVLQFDRSDWPDILNLIDAIGPQLDWKHLLSRMRQDTPLLTAMLALFRWMSPERAKELPAWLWKAVGLSDEVAPAGLPVDTAHRASLLDSRDWFGPKETLDA